MLLQDLIARTAQAGKAVTLGVVKRNPARSLYERHGFHVTPEDRYRIHMVRRA